MPRKKRNSVGGANRTGRGPGRPRGSGGALAAIAGLNVYRNQLVSQRNAVDERIAAIDGALAAMGGGGGGGGGGARPIGAGSGRGRHGPRKGSLKEYIAKVVSAGGGVMAVKDITAGVLKIGYKTRNKTLAKSVGIALTEMSNIRKVGRGQFALK